MCVLSGLKRFVGKIDRTATASIKKSMGKDFVVLKDAYELDVRMSKTAAGVQVDLTPAPIAPFSSRATITTRVDTLLDVSGSPEMREMGKIIDRIDQQEARSPSGLVIPGGIRTPQEQAELDRRMRGGR